MYKLAFYVPKEQKEEVKEALFAIGAGAYENYDMCSWEVEGTGQFRPLLGAKPFLGSRGEIERVAEYRAEMICKEELIQKAVQTLKETHPYEEVAYEVLKLEDF